MALLPRGGGTPTFLAEAKINGGSEDWQANPEQVSKLGLLINVPVHVVPANGHMLDHGYVRGVLDRWVSLD